ncbi:MAG: hypothetical protein KAY37_08855 [Phycisphaerae bacterium]|nr:hypothetical protein [Phycisphaerae bacterium]
MTLFRMIVILAGGVALLLCVVILRAETTRLHYEISQCELQAEEMRLRLRAAELELARLRNPMVMRKKVAEAVEMYMNKELAPDGGAESKLP